MNHVQQKIFGQNKPIVLSGFNRELAESLGKHNEKWPEDELKEINKHTHELIKKSNCSHNKENSPEKQEELHQALEGFSGMSSEELEHTIKYGTIDVDVIFIGPIIES